MSDDAQQAPQARTRDARRRLGVLVFPGFETLDAFGPLQMFGNVRDAVETVLVSQDGGSAASSQGQSVVVDYDFASCPTLDLLLVPGGFGTRAEVENRRLLAWITERAAAAELVASVCTGAALLAKAGLLDGRQATTNKRAFAWVASQGPHVRWVARARWVEDGRFFTAAGVSAGIDMSLAVIARLLGRDASERLAAHAEYDWHRDPSWDPFAAMNGLA